MPSTSILKDLIRYIVFEVQERGAELYRTRLVKLLYLCEVEYYRSMGKRLTDLKWIRYYFGPFAFELEQATRSIGFVLESESVDFERGQGIRYRLQEDRALYDLLPGAIRGIADNVIARWADEDLNALLDYVYCETEPMKDTFLMDGLDFRKVDPGRKRIVDIDIELPEGMVKALRERIAEEGSISRQPAESSTDAETAEAMVEVEGAPDLSSLEGTVRPSTSQDLGMMEGQE